MFSSFSWPFGLAFAPSGIGSIVPPASSLWHAVTGSSCEESQAERSRSFADKGVSTINVGVFLPNWIGDVVMATPMLRALRQWHGPAARIVAVARPYVMDVLTGTHWLDEMVPFERRSENRALRSWGVAQRLRQLDLDRIYLLTNSFRAAAISWAAGVTQRVGYVRYGRGPLLTDPFQPPRVGRKLDPVSAVDYYLHLIEAMGATGLSRRVELQTTPENERLADQIWQRLNLDRGPNVIALNIGAAYGAAKHWPAEHFAALATMIVREYDTRVLVTCGPSERDEAWRITRLANHDRVVSLSDQPVSIGLTKAAIRRSSMLVTTDSGPRHFGAAFNVPTVTLFGPTDPRWSENYHPRAMHLQLDLECSPCARRECPLAHHRCMRELEPGHVMQAVRAMAATGRAIRAA